MSQLFSPQFGLMVKLGALAAFALLAGGVWVWRTATAMPHGERVPVEQPVPFSHRHHVDDDGIDCRYCHGGVEQTAFAGLPPLSTCMGCHAQLFTDQQALRPLLDAWERGTPLAWNRVNQLPGFVYFNHGVHVAKGVGCASCHGDVASMPRVARMRPLTMAWCLDCHRQPERFLRPREQVFDTRWAAADQLALGRRLLAAYHIDKRRLLDCSLCHR